MYYSANKQPYLNYIESEKMHWLLEKNRGLEQGGIVDMWVFTTCPCTSIGGFRGFRFFFFLSRPLASFSFKSNNVRLSVLLLIQWWIHSDSFMGRFQQINFIGREPTVCLCDPGRLRPIITSYEREFDILAIHKNTINWLFSIDR